MEKRVSYLRDVPTFTELGYAAECPQSWVALYAPAGLHPTVLKKLSDAFKKAYDDPSFREVLRTFSLFPEYRDSESLTKLVHEDYDSRGEMIKKMGWK